MARFTRRLLLAVDLRQYSRHDYDQQQDAQYRLRLVVEHALRRARVPRVRVQQQLQGDGQLVVFPPRTDSVRAVPALVLGLRDGLHRANQAPGAFGRLRMRAALSQGPLARADRGYVGDCVVLVNRLLDSEALRRELERATDSDLALALTEDLFRDAVAAQPRGLHTADFHRAEIATPAKGFSATAWLHAPRSAPAADLGPEPVVWGHSPARAAIREYAVPALGAAHLAATVLANSTELREWLLPGTGAHHAAEPPGPSADFDEGGVTYAHDAHPDAHDAHGGAHRAGHHGDAHHAGDHAGDAHHAGHHAGGHHGPDAGHHAGDGPHDAEGHHDGEAHHGDDGHHAGEGHHGDAHHDGDPYHHGDDGHHGGDPYHHGDDGHHDGDPYHHDAGDGHHDPDPYHHGDVAHHDPDPYHHDDGGGQDDGAGAGGHHGFHFPHLPHFHHGGHGS
ncbi:MAG: hypothetical protein HOY69_03880 [Streptomyces sp.]|nr:hypothetical protein [Streptomyces sp.]